MKIAIYIDTLPFSGGGIQSINYAIKFDKIINSLGFESQIVTDNNETLNLLKDTVNTKIYKKSIVDTICFNLTDLRIFRFFLKKIKFQTRFEKYFKKNRVDLIIFTSPSSKSLYLNSINYILCVWDICHRNNLEFKEIKENFEFEIREDFYNVALKKSFLIICDTDELCEDISFYYRIKKNRLITIPFEINQKFISLKGKKLIGNRNYKNYFIYPAQFWSHKNHFYLLEAFRKIKNKKIKLILCGSDKGHLKNVKSYINKFNLKDNVLILNYIKDEDLFDLYQNCIGLIMPTIFGYSNIPPIEAWFFNKHVIYNKKFTSFYRGSKFHPIDPLNSDSIYKAILKILKIKNLKNEKFSQNVNVTKNNKLIISGTNKLKENIKDFYKLQKCWNYD